MSSTPLGRRGGKSAVPGRPSFVSASLLRLLSRPLRRRGYLSHLRFDPAELSGVTFKLAENPWEREQAFRLLHDVYVQRGLLDPSPDGLRVSVFSVLPTTAVFIGIRDGRVLSTMSLIEDSALGLPMEELYGPEITRLRRVRHRIAEVGALAIAPEVRGRGWNLMMYNLMFRWAHFYRGIDDLAIAVNPRAADFYRTVILFEPLGELRTYARLKNAPAVALDLNLRSVVRRLRRIYDSAFSRARNAHPASNLYRFFLTDEYPNLLLPPGAGETALTSPPEWEPGEAMAFLSRRPEEIARLKADQRAFLHELYPQLSPRRTPSAPRPVPARVSPGPGWPRRRVLFFGEAVTLAHVGRPLALATRLDPRCYDPVFACDPRFERLYRTAGVSFRPIRSIPTDRFLRALAAGSPVYDVETLREYVAEDLDVIRSVDPDVVVGDFRLSLSASARLANVPYLAITNACWSPYASRDIRLGDHPARRFLGDAAAQSLFRMLRPIALAYHARPLNRVRKELGLRSVGYDLRKVFTEADYTLYADIPQLAPTSILPANHHFLGPILWSPDAPMPSLRIDGGRPAIYVTLGSSGRSDLLASIVGALADLPVTQWVATAGRIELADPPANARVAAFLPGTEIAAQASLVICNGGSPTTHQALAAGVPVLGVVGNMNQYLNMEMIRRAGAGELLETASLDGEALRSLVARLLAAPAYAAAARSLASAFAAYDPALRLHDLLTRIPARSRAAA
jgi:UDP:flavonoid glycosyltransferase YjiC (YdhE family)